MRHAAPIAAAALAAAMAFAALPASAAQHGDNEWSIIHVDREGNEVPQADAFESVAMVEGRRNLRLEVGCNRNDKYFLRVRQIADDAETADFLSGQFRPRITILYEGDELYTTRLDRWEFSERRQGYQGRANAELFDWIRRGGRLVLEAPQKEFRAGFALDGSLRVLDQIRNCD